MSFNIALAGKGSAGKSTLIPHLVRFLTAAFPSLRLLVVDADPHMSSTTLLEQLPDHTLGSLRSAYERELARGTGLQDETRVAFAERMMGEQAIIRLKGFDLLALGHWEPLGSQCTVNRVLERSFEQLTGQYDLVLFDHEAGIEQMGRFANIPLDLLILVATPDPLFIDVADRIVERRNEVQRQIETTWLVLNRVQPGDLDDGVLHDLIGSAQLELITHLPESPALRYASRALLSPLTVDPSDPWVQSVHHLGGLIETHIRQQRTA